jgi:chromosomal replication initiation ATPase DnaA
VLLKQFADRQLRVGPGVVAYLVPRMERSFASAASLAAELDRRALAAGRPVTIKLARAVLSETLG